MLNGEVLEQQRDRQSAELKHRIGGRSLDGRSLEVVAKIGPTGRLVIITVYEDKMVMSLSPSAGASHLA